MKSADLTVADVIKLLKTGNNDIQSVEEEYQHLKDEDASLIARNLNAARTFQQLSNDISEEYKILNQHRLSSKEERVVIDKLRLQKEKPESVVRQSQNNNEDFRRIRELVRQSVEQSLANNRHLL